MGRFFNRVLDLIEACGRAVLRERVVLMGLGLAILEAVNRGEITKATAVPVIAGIIVRFFTTPFSYKSPLPPGDDGKPHGTPLR
jgi:hypothetical protein